MKRLNGQARPGHHVRSGHAKLSGSENAYACNIQRDIEFAPNVAPDRRRRRPFYGVTADSGAVSCPAGDRDPGTVRWKGSQMSLHVKYATRKLTSQ